MYHLPNLYPHLWNSQDPFSADFKSRDRIYIPFILFSAYGGDDPHGFVYPLSLFSAYGGDTPRGFISPFIIFSVFGGDTLHGFVYPLSLFSALGGELAGRSYNHRCPQQKDDNADQASCDPVHGRNKGGRVFCRIGEGGEHRRLQREDG